jgi:4-amino-4-deoxy-L-arabinose transferase-like glycosyltransferase
MGYDQGMMASVGDVIVRGGMPYRDGFELKGPLTFYFFALVQTFFGRVMWGIRLLDLSLLFSSAACFYSILKRMIGSATISRWMALSLVLAAASRSWFHASQPDGWATAFVTFAVYLSLKERQTKLTWLAAGFLIGAAALIKPFYILCLPLPLVIGISGALGTAVFPAVLTLSGAALPAVGTLAWFGWKGALGDMVAVQIGFNLQAYSGVGAMGIGRVIESLGAYMWSGAPRVPPGPFGVLLIPIVAGIVFAWRERRAGGFGLLLWLATALACVALQRKFYVYHWLTTFPPLLAITGLALARISAHAAARALTAISIGLFLCGVAVRPAWDAFCFAKYATGLDSRKAYLSRFTRFDYRATAATDAASYLKAHTHPEEGVAVFGVDAIVQYLSERRSPTRFVFSLPLNVPDKSYRDRYRAEYIDALRRTPPRYIVLGTSQDEASTSSEFPELAELLTQGYQIDQTIGKLELYRLQDNVGLTKP